MRATENLIKEHRKINELLNIMSKIANRIKSKDVFYPSDVDEIVDYLVILIDKSHHGKEDEVFYPELILSGVPKEKAPLSMIDYEHTLAKRYLNDITGCVVNCKIGNDFSGELLADSMTKYVVVIQNHIQREEETIFPIADKVFSVEQQAEITKRFENIEAQAISYNFSDRFNQLLNKLRMKYADREKVTI